MMFESPDLRVRHKQQLLGGELREPRQLGLGALAGHGVGVGAVGLADAAIVRDVLPLAVLPVQLKIENEPRSLHLWIMNMPSMGWTVHERPRPAHPPARAPRTRHTGQ